MLLAGLIVGIVHQRLIKWVVFKQFSWWCPDKIDDNLFLLEAMMWFDASHFLHLFANEKWISYKFCYVLGYSFKQLFPWSSNLSTNCSCSRRSCELIRSKLFHSFTNEKRILFELYKIEMNRRQHQGFCDLSHVQGRLPGKLKGKWPIYAKKIN